MTEEAEFMETREDLMNENASQACDGVMPCSAARNFEPVPDPGEWGILIGHSRCPAWGPRRRTLAGGTGQLGTSKESNASA
jgi:hypothetical protein